MSRCRALAVLVLCLAAGALALARDTPVDAASSDCRGVAATITGGDGPDAVTGTPKRDVIQANGGNDTVDGRGGGDLICGGAGDDRLGGGASFDALDGEAGNDTLLGGDADDVLFGGPGDDPQLDGGQGFDIAYGEDGVDACTASERNYRCEGVVQGTDASVPTEIPKTVPCDYLAAPTGDDGNPGSFSEPYRTVERLVNTLKPGETGCLQPGAVFTEPDDEINVRAQGTTAKPVVLRTTPGGAQATIRGRLWFCADTPLSACTTDGTGSHDVELRDLVLDGRNRLGPFQGSGGPEALPSPTVNGDQITFTHVNVTNPAGPCFVIGSVNGYGVAENTWIRGRSRIHGCGRVGSMDLPISLEASRAALIEHSLIYDNPDIGVYIYADAQGSTIRNNVIDGNGRALRFDPSGPYHPEGTLVTGNVISNSTLPPDPDGSEHYQVEGGFTGSPPWSNRVNDNCLFHASGRNFHPGQTAYSESGNTFATSGPGYQDRVNFRLRGGPGECPVRFGPQEEAPPPVEPPQRGRSVKVRPGKGRGSRFVRIRRKRVVTRANRRFLPLIAGARIPVGSTVNAKGRAVRLEAAVAPGRTRTMKVSRGSFVVRQSRSRRPVTELVLPSFGRRTSTSSVRAHAAFGVGIRFEGRWHRFRVRGDYAIASRPRSRIVVRNLRRGTLVRAVRGRVTVRDCGRRRPFTLRAPKDHLAKRRRC